MFRFAPVAAVVTSAVLAAACSTLTASAPAKAQDGVLVGPNQMTLYTFDKDAAGSGKSVCNAQCAAAWPPLMAQADARPTATGRSSRATTAASSGPTRECRCTTG